MEDIAIRDAYFDRNALLTAPDVVPPIYSGYYQGRLARVLEIPNAEFDENFVNFELYCISLQRHPNMAKFYGHARTNENHYFILEHGVTLGQFLTNANFERRRNTMKDISEAASYLWDSKFSLSNLNSEDVIVVEGHDGFQAKICCLEKLSYLGKGDELSKSLAFQVGWNTSKSKNKEELKVKRALRPLFIEIIAQWGNNESADLIDRLATDPRFGPSQVRFHPLFWDVHKRMRFFIDVSNWLFNCNKITDFERTNFGNIFDKAAGWAKKLNPDILDEVHKGLTSNFTIPLANLNHPEKKISYLVKSIRNIDVHFRTVTHAAETVLLVYLQRTSKGPDLTVGAYFYFASTFPGLLVHTYGFVKKYQHTGSLLERYWKFH